MSSQNGKPVPQGVVAVRSQWKSRINALRKQSLLNPYWVEHKWLVRSVEFLAEHATGQLLDVGGGERPYGELFESRVDRYVGLEYPPSADSLHPEIWGVLDRLQGVVDVFGDGMRMPFKDDSFDTVMSLEVFEHLADPDACLREIERVMRPDGVLLFTVPFVAPLHQLPFDYYRFTPQGIAAMLDRHGFEVEHIMARGNFSSTMGTVVAHWVLRTFGSKRQHHDGSVKLSRWRAPLLSPLIALIQGTAMICEKFTTDETMTFGYGVVARRRS